MSSTDTCQQCGEEYSQIGSHWARSSECNYRSLTQKQHEITTGFLMGDGYIHRPRSGNSNPRLGSQMISKDYLTYIDEQFGVFGHGVKLNKTAEESAKHNRQRGFRPNACADDYSDLYQWQTMQHPDFHEFAEWYSTGEKVWPEDIHLTPTVLKHWYCGDGTWHNNGTNNCIRITMSKEVENTEKVDKIFKNVGLSSPNNYNICERKDGHIDCTATFTVSQSEELWSYMGEPLPDFEYKWPEKYH